MKILSIIFGYLGWHYSKAIRSLTRVWKIFLTFIFNYFSIDLLFKNFLDPWKRMNDNYPKNFNLKDYFYAFVTNMIVRIVGIIMRTILIIIGLTCYIAFALFYPLAIIGWLLLPSLIVVLIIFGVILIIK
jgi:hypothetical protein